MLVVLLGLLLKVTLQITASSPTWLASPQFCSGQYKAINQFSTLPGTLTTTQTLNCTSLGNTPRIILSLQGYRQNSSPNSIVGFNNIVVNLTATSFTSNYTIFGSNMLYLFYRYLVINYTATQYYSSYQNLILGNGNTFSPLSSIQIFANPPGQNFTTFYTNKIRSKIFLVGFKMNVTSTGTSIQLSSEMRSPTTHSITVTTSGSSKIMQVNYFRLAFDFTSLTKGYNIFIDQLNLITGGNCNTVLTNVNNFIPVNYLMGFNVIQMSSTNNNTDILLNLTNTSTPYTFSVKTFNGLQSPQYIYLKANIFIHRIRQCLTQTPYYNPIDKLCYDECPVKRFNIILGNYCQQCHHTCYKCNGNLSTNCLTCDPAVFRTINNATSSCVCRIGYYQTTQIVYISPENHQCSQFPISGYNKNNMVCRPCIPTCQTCSLNSSNCLSCIGTQYRTLSINNCICDNGFYQISINNPVVCLACNPTCRTCIQNQNRCLTCFPNQNRILSSSNNTCICLNGSYESSLNSPATCLACHSTCLTCLTINTFCLTCNATNYRVLSGNTCACVDGYYNTSVNSSSICLACHSTCSTCNQTSTYCLSCNSLQFRTINLTRNTCSCLPGYYQISINNPHTCLLCIPTCLTCNNSSQTCLTCNSSQYRLLNTTTKNCDCRVGYFQYPSNSNNYVCARCLSTCQSCQNYSTYCMTCNASLNRVLNTTTHSCLCKNGYYETISNSNFICLPCDSTRNQTYDFATRFCVCMAGYYNDTINNRGCQPCSIIPGCTFCLIQISASNITCTSCNLNENYQLNRISNSNISNCSCIPGSYLNVSGNVNYCPSCNYKCLTCTNSYSCKSCSISIQKRIQNSATSDYCECIPGYFDDGMSTICKQCDVKCLTCSNQHTCLSCDSRVRYLSNGTCLCNQGYYQSNNYGQCVGDGINNLYCGNGNIQRWQQCDDYNKKDGDGCSSVCKVEKFHVCNQYSNFNGTSLCYYNNSINMRLQSITKSLNDNKINLSIRLEAIGCNLSKLKQYTQNLNSLYFRSTGRNLQQFSESRYRILQIATNISISSSIFTITDQINYQGTLDLVLDYTADIQTLQNRQISFISSESEQNFLKYFFGTPMSSAKLTDPTNRIPMRYIQQKYYSSAAVLSYISLIIICISLAFFLIMSFIEGSVIPIQNILIIQLAYFFVLGQRQVELGLANLAFFGKFSSGVNIDILKPALIEMCVKLSTIYQQCNSIDNINLFFWLATISFFIVIGFLIYKYRKNKQLMVYDVQQNTKKKLDQSSIKGSQNNNVKQLSDSEEHNKKNEEYQLPNKSKKLVKVCLELAVGVYFMTAIEFLLIALNLGGQYKSLSIAWVVVVGLLFIGLWSIYFTQYNNLQLSYIDILKYNNNKVSLPKLFYPALFVFLMVWGAILSFVLPVISYTLLITMSCIWLVLTLRFELYKTKPQKIRATINQIITILISILYIVLQYAVKDGIGLAYAIILQLILFGSLINNIGFYTYEQIIKRKSQHKQQEKEQQYFKNIQQQFMTINLNKRMEQEQPIQNRKGGVSLNQYESMAIKRQVLLDAIDTKQALRGKLNQLKALRNQFKADKNQKDKKIIGQIQMINYFSKMN